MERNIRKDLEFISDIDSLFEEPNDIEKSEWVKRLSELRKMQNYYIGKLSKMGYLCYSHSFKMKSIDLRNNNVHGDIVFALTVLKDRIKKYKEETKMKRKLRELFNDVYEALDELMYSKMISAETFRELDDSVKTPLLDILDKLKQDK